MSIYLFTIGYLSGYKIERKVLYKYEVTSYFYFLSLRFNRTMQFFFALELVTFSTKLKLNLNNLNNFLILFVITNNIL